MVGIVIVSHSHLIAEGVAELAREMGGPDVRLETAGGLNMPDHPIGTDAVMVMEAIERAWSDDGVLVLMDLGSAVLSAEMALDLMPEERRSQGPALRGADRGRSGGRRRDGEARCTSRSGRSRGSRWTCREDRRTSARPHPMDNRPRRRRRSAPGPRSPADRDGRTRLARAARGALRADRVVVRRHRLGARPDERSRAGRCGQLERRRDARVDAGTRDRGHGNRAAGGRGAGGDRCARRTRLRRSTGAAFGGASGPDAATAGRRWDRAWSRRLAGDRDRARAAVPNPRPADPRGCAPTPTSSVAALETALAPSATRSPANGRGSRDGGARRRG